MHSSHQDSDRSRNSVEIAADPSVVFDVVADPTTYPLWLVGSKAIDHVDAHWPDVGTKFHHRIGFGPLTVPGSSTVLEVEPPRRLRLGAGMGPFGEVDVDLSIHPCEAGSRVEIAETPRRGLARVVRQMVRPAVHLALWGRNAVSLSALQEVVETTPPR